MKIGSLYVRILLAFIGVLTLSLLIVGTLVHSGRIRPPITRYAEERTASIKQMLGRELEGEERFTPELRDRLDQVLTIFAHSFRGQAWISDQKGVTVCKSFNGPAPLTGREAIHHTQSTPDGDKLYLLERDHGIAEAWAIYSVATIHFGDEELSVHLLNKWRKRREELWLMKGLLLMGCLSALLLIPVSRRISSPLNKLTKSAEHIARGDFSPRVDTGRNDEVGKLTKAFNGMVDALEKMIRGGRELNANLSHELRSPLARIRISQQILRERLESGRTDGMEAHLEKMEAEINHMDGLIDKILRLSKLDLQEPQPREDIIDLGTFLEKTVERHRPLITDKALEVSLSVDAPSAYRCREEDLRMALDNVMANAVKYSRDNAAISVTASSDEEAVTIRVANPYRSLPAEELESVFVAFKRLGYDEVEGNGLGLAFARKLVEEHGGTMTATSRNGAFVMTINLPLD